MRNRLGLFGIVCFLLSNGLRGTMDSKNEEGNLISDFHLRSGHNNTFIAT